MKAAVREQLDGKTVLQNPTARILGYLRNRLGYPLGTEGLHLFRDETNALSKADQIWFMVQADKELAKGESY